MGQFKGTGDEREWWVPSEVWKQILRRPDPVAVARTLFERGMLRKQDDKHLQCVVKIGTDSRRAYVLTAAILDGSDDEE